MLRARLSWQMTQAQSAAARPLAKHWTSRKSARTLRSCATSSITRTICFGQKAIPNSTGGRIPEPNVLSGKETPCRGISATRVAICASRSAINFGGMRRSAIRAAHLPVNRPTGILLRPSSRVVSESKPCGTAGAPRPRRWWPRLFLVPSLPLENRAPHQGRGIFATGWRRLPALITQVEGSIC